MLAEFIEAAQRAFAMGAVRGDLAALLVAQQVERCRDVEGGLRQDGAQQQACLRQAEVHESLPQQRK